MKVLPACLIISTYMFLGGCASPLVKYGQVTGPDQDGLAKFSFTESVIKFDLKKDMLGGKNIEIASVPVPESSDKVYYLDGTSVIENWGVTTDIVPAYRGDTKLLKSISVTTTDKRALYIEKTAGIVGKAMTFGVSTQDVDENPLPKGIDVQPLLNACDPKTICKRNEKTGNYSIELTISPLPVDAFTRPPMENSVYKTNTFLYSACRNVGVSLKLNNTIVAESSVTVADSRFVESLAFPEKGTVTAGASCSATAESGVSSNPGGMEYIDTLLGAAQTVVTARKERNKKE
ncbi:hypothetical protein [Pseudomonas fluorescens]|uniref:hypothetical protein n=1 Tax=Pseudomonas fluorescens TaxID=294 RepID=UPI001A9FB94B|nr:hypothetical protein [Pseudomonas fluorescens]QTD31304.1 hypothetical protein JZM58_18620 [Pseudomonas fluorescens]